MSLEEHRKKAPKNLNVGIITVSDSRSASAEKGEDKDISGAKIQEKLEEKDHSSERIIIPDEEDEIEEELMEFINNPEIDAVITTGGTGIAKRDKTIE
ncbi:MAG: molybdenum cofactor biosynthesis protein, partial [Hadesarchaea archaeon]|nr:molybdenum cofactor biosynthesis protein [Hadesarchaea archaeon]